MTQIPYGIGSYRRADLPQVQLVNMYAEKVPEVPGNVVLLPRPALSPYLSVGSGPIRGVFHQDGVLSDALFSVSGANLYNGQGSLGAVTGTSTIAMIAADIYLLVSDGTNLFRSDGASFETIAFPDGAGVGSLAYLGGYAIAVRAGTRHLYFTLDTSTWDGLDYVSAEQSTANIVGIEVVVDQLWVFCTDHTEIMYLSGDSDAPLQRVQGRVFDKGAKTAESIVRVDNTVFWVGNDNIVYRGDSIPKRISDHGIEERVSGSTSAVAFSYSWLGHLFYILNLDGATMAYDAATEQWHELQSYGRARWRANGSARLGNQIILGDDETGQLWTLSDGAHTDNGDVIADEFTVIIDQEGFLDNLALDCTTGVLGSPNDAPGIIELRTSRDGGQVWTNWRETTLGTQGQYRKRAVWRRLGKIDQGDMIIQFRMTSPVPLRVSEVRVNEPLGGRSR